MYELNYGIGTPKQSDFTHDFAPVGQIELRVGRSEIDKYSGTNVELNNRYLFLSYLSSSISATDPAAGEIMTTSYRFGIGVVDGIGYTAGHDFSISPYVGQSFVWTKLTDFSESLEPEPGETPSDDYLILEQYLGRFRFGDRATYGIKTEIY